jgi:hypothetical protein
MGGGAFKLLKSGRERPESTNQVEICLANLLKILAIARRGVQNGWRGPGDNMRRLHPDFHRIWLMPCEISRFVSWITIFAGKLTQYPAGRCSGKLIKVSALN